MTISNSDLIILQVINDNKNACGYRINKIVTERGSGLFENIASSSIYAGLKKLEKEKIVESEIVLEKKGRGPLPKSYKLTHAGKNLLREEVREALVSVLSSNTRFSAALSALKVLPRNQIQKCFEKRIKNLEEMLATYKVSKKKDKKVSMADTVFNNYINDTVKSDLRFAKKILKEI